MRSKRVRSKPETPWRPNQSVNSASMQGFQPIHNFTIDFLRTGSTVVKSNNARELASIGQDDTVIIQPSMAITDDTNIGFICHEENATWRIHSTRDYGKSNTEPMPGIHDRSLNIVTPHSHTIRHSNATPTNNQNL